MAVTGVVHVQKVTVHVEIGEEVAQVEAVGALDTDIEVLVTKMEHVRVLHVQNMDRLRVHHGIHQHARIMFNKQLSSANYTMIVLIF